MSTGLSGDLEALSREVYIYMGILSATDIVFGSRCLTPHHYHFFSLQIQKSCCQWWGFFLSHYPSLAHTPSGLFLFFSKYHSLRWAWLLWDLQVLSTQVWEQSPCSLTRLMGPIYPGFEISLLVLIGPIYTQVWDQSPCSLPRLTGSIYPGFRSESSCRSYIYPGLRSVSL